jgi:hypothetical protein
MLSSTLESLQSREIGRFLLLFFSSSAFRVILSAPVFGSSHSLEHPYLVYSYLTINFWSSLSSFDLYKMHFNSLALASLALIPSLIEAHGDIPGAPRVFGRRPALSGPMRARTEASDHQSVVSEIHDKRQAASNTEGQCGPGFGSCANGYCCSEAGKFY